LSDPYPYVSGNVTNGTAPECDLNNSCVRKQALLNLTQIAVDKSEESMKDAVVNQPVSVAVCAQFWQFYSSGIFNHINSLSRPRRTCRRVKKRASEASEPFEHPQGQPLSIVESTLLR